MTKRYVIFLTILITIIFFRVSHAELFETVLLEVDGIRWGVAPDEIAGLKFQKTTWDGASFYNKDNKIFGFYNNRLYYYKVSFEDEEKLQKEISDLDKAYAEKFGKGKKTDLYDLEWKIDHIRISHQKSEGAGLRVLNTKVKNQKDRALEKKWNRLVAREGWKYLQWGMTEDEVRKQLEENDPDYDNWGWKHERLSRKLIVDFDRILGDREVSYFKFRNNENLKHYSIGTAKNIYFYDGYLLGVSVGYERTHKERVFFNLKERYPKGNVKFLETGDVMHNKKPDNNTNENLVSIFKFENKKTLVFTTIDEVYFFDRKVRERLLVTIQKRKDDIVQKELERVDSLF